MKKHLLKGILAGIMIAIGGTVLLKLDNSILGAFLFSIGLLVIVMRGFNLYTGKVGYIVNNDKKYILEVIWSLVGNIIGTFLSAKILISTRIGTKLIDNATILCNTKLADSPVSIFLLSVFCGILMYIAVDTYKTKEDFGKYLGVLICVPVFILAGFEHSIANIFYFSVCSMWGLKTALYVVLMILGNAVGGMLIPFVVKYIKE